MINSLLCKFDKPFDYVGQVSAKKHIFNIFLVGYTLSLVIGFMLSDLLYTLVLGVATFFTAFVAVIPSWPHYRKNPLKFRSPK